MSRRCEISGKKARRANNVSHSNQKTIRRQKPNLQYITIDGQRFFVASNVRRTLLKHARKEAA